MELPLKTLLAQVAAMRVRAEEAERNAHVVAKELESLERQIRAVAASG